MNDKEEIKDAEERRIKIAAFSRLKQEIQKSEMEKLVEKHKVLEAAFLSNEKAKQSVQSQKKKMADDANALKDQYVKERNKRQRLFAEGMDTRDSDSKIWKLHLDIEAQEALWADAVAGLESKLSDLEKEMELLRREKEETLRTILEFEQVPLVLQYNKEIAQAMKTLEKVFDGQESLNYTFQATGGSRFQMLYLSDWEGLEHVGKLYFAGDIAEEDRRPFGRLKGTWSMREYRERKQKKLEKIGLE
jgi:hypothetical protein